MKRILLLTFFAIALAATSRIWLPLAGKFLLVKDDFQKADCIVVLRGEEYFRFQKAVELYREDYAKNIVVSVLPGTSVQSYDMVRKIYNVDRLSEKDLVLKFFRYFEKDTTGIQFTGAETTSTFDEALAAKKLLKEKGFHSLILVTSTYHMRRALLIFEWVFRGSGIRIDHVTAPAAEIYDPEHWWTHERDIRRLAEEYPSLLVNFIYHVVLGKQKTSFDTV